MTEDLDALARELEAYINERSPSGADARVSGLRRMAEGWSRESFAFTVESATGGERASQPLIMRRDPVASLIDTDRTVEFRVIEALHAAGMAVPRPFWLETDTHRPSAPFMIMEMLPGTAVPEVLYAPNFGAERRALGRQFFTFLGQLHSMNVGTLGLADVLPPPADALTATRAEIDRWDAVVAAKKPEPQPVLREVSHW
ncbi:MAG: phosphotransferase, partial [Dehalococcoidia bacterium]|nr:phosphotransferase [Dehalococcoidia bacterium]